VIQQGGGTAGRSKADPAPVSPAQRSDPAIFRAACAEAFCPPVEFPVPAYGVIWQQAERCLQDKYIEAHPRNTVGTATSWVGLTGKNPHEQATIDFFRSHYTGKGFKPKKDPQNVFPDSELEREGSRQRQAEPDIFDFTDQVILEITTPAGVPYRAQKIVWEVELANKLMFESGIGGKQLWMPGFWQPSPLRRRRRIFARSEHDIAAVRVGACVDRSRGSGSVGIRVYSHVTEVMTVARVEGRTQIRR
jgi:hypothetical protein